MFRDQQRREIRKKYSEKSRCALSLTSLLGKISSGEERKILGVEKKIKVQGNYIHTWRRNLKSLINTKKCREVKILIDEKKKNRGDPTWSSLMEPHPHASRKGVEPAYMSIDLKKPDRTLFKTQRQPDGQNNNENFS